MTTPAYHVSNAMIDRNGRVIAVGQIDYPSDDENLFPNSPHGHLALLFDDACQHLSLVPTSLEDDLHGNLCKTKDADLRVFLPSPLVPVLMRVFRFGSYRPIRMTCSNLQGSLRSTKNKLSPTDQLVNDWQIEIEEVDGDISIKMSAALHSGENRTLSIKEESNHWSRQNDDPARLNIFLKVDLVTRAVKWSAFDKKLSPEDEVDSIGIEPAGDTLCIKNGLFGYNGRLNGLLVEGLFGDVYITEAIGLNGFCIHQSKAQTVNLNGFVQSSDRVYPGIWVKCLAFVELLRPLIWNKTATLAFQGSHLGSLEYKPLTLNDYECGYHNPHQVIKALSFELDLEETGLHIAYEAKAEEVIGGVVKRASVEGRLHFSWSTVIVKFPYLAHHASSFNLKDNEDSTPASHCRVPDSGLMLSSED